MSETKAKAAETKAAAKPAAVGTDPVTRYSIGKLRRYAANLFGVSTSTFDGAFFGRQGEYTVDEAKKLLDAWLNAPAAL